VELTRICVASIRTWYPEIPIWLLKDQTYGPFSTHEIERMWDVQVHPASRRNLGWGFGKLEVLIQMPSRRLLVLDSDIVFAGKVLERLEQFEEDLVVHREEYSSADVETHFFVLEKLRRLDPAFESPGYAFNTGQMVVTTGRLTKEDFDGLVDWEQRTVRHPDIFKLAEQGLLNYVAQRKAGGGGLTIRREPFMVWPGLNEATAHIRVEALCGGKGYQELIHWAGLRWGKSLRQMPRADILTHFEKAYYERVPFGRLLQSWRGTESRVRESMLRPLIRLRRRLSGAVSKA
jgi:hypothetical protein